MSSKNIKVLEELQEKVLPIDDAELSDDSEITKPIAKANFSQGQKLKAKPPTYKKKVVYESSSSESSDESSDEEVVQKKKKHYPPPSTPRSKKPQPQQERVIQYF